MATELPDANWFHALRAPWGHDPQRTAVQQIESGDSPALHYSWQDLDAGSGRMANWLTHAGLVAGERVAVQVDKSVEALMLYLACLRAGLVFVPLNSAYPAAELAFFLEDSAPAALVCAPTRFAELSTLAFMRGVRHVFTLSDQRSGTLLDRAVFHPDAHQPVCRQADDLAALIYTSGTTGRSKGAMLTHGNLAANARTLLDYWDWRASDVLLHALPIFHVHGLFVAIHSALAGGSRMLWLNRPQAAAVAAALPRATVFMHVPTLYTRLLEEPAFTRASVAGMRLFVSGSAPLRSDTFDAFTQRSGHQILERYGMSETLMIASNPCRPGDGERRAGTVGRALPGVQVRVVDAEHGRSLPAGSIGQVQTKGPSVCAGYWQREEASRAAFTADGWFDTGDVGRLDADGVLTLVGRSKDVIISGGFNIYPAEVERCLDALPGVAESAVVAVPDADFGEAVAAMVVPQPGATLDPAELIKALKTQIAGFKVPRRIESAAVLPRNTMGKVQKNLIRAQMVAGQLR